MEYTSKRLRRFGNRRGWFAVLSGTDDSGKRKRKTQKMEATGKREAQREMDALFDELNRAARIEASGHVPGETVADYVWRYVEERAETVEPSTMREYRRLARNQIAPTVGKIPLDELAPDAVQAWVTDMGKRWGVPTVVKAFVLLKSAMTQAVERDRLAKNPTRTVKPPKRPKPMPNALDERGRAAVLSVIAAAPPSPGMLGVKLALYTGLREGELCGLRWRDVDVEARTLTVSEAIGHDGPKWYVKRPKTEGSARIVSYPAEVAADLAARRAEMDAKCAAAGIAFEPSMYVLGDVDGSFMSPHALWAKWRSLSDMLGLVGTQGKRPTFHDLRHTYATAAITAGVDVKTVSNSMGHSNAAMTLNTYASADPDARRRAAEAVGAAYAAGIEAMRREPGAGGESEPAEAPGEGANGTLEGVPKKCQ